MRLCKKEYWHLVLICPVVWFSGKTIRKKNNDKIHIYAQHMAWFTCFWLEKSIIGDENWLGKWLSDPKNRLVLVLPELVVRRGQDLKRCFFAENNSFGCISKVGAWKGHTLEKVHFCLPKIVFPSYSRDGALEGQGLKKWFSLANNRFSIFL